MTYVYEELMTETIHALRARLAHAGAGWARTETKKELAERYILLTSAAQPSDIVAQPDNEKAKPEPASKITQDELLEALKPFRLRGLNVSVSDDGSCWGMTHGERVDSGSMTMPVSQLVRCAEMVMLGSRV